MVAFLAPITTSSTSATRINPSELCGWHHKKIEHLDSGLDTNSPFNPPIGAADLVVRQ